MKNKISSIILAATLAIPCFAQERQRNLFGPAPAVVITASELVDLQVAALPDTNVITSPQSFGASLINYFTAFDTNSTTFLTNDTLDISVGSTTIENKQLAADFLAEFNIGKKFSVEADIRNATVAGTIVSFQGGFGYSLVHYDTKVTGFIDGGYKTDIKLPYIAPGIRAKKALTQNTFGQIGIELPIYLHGNEGIAPSYTISVGAKL